MYFQRVVSQYNLEVARLFQQRGVTIPYPQRDIYIKQMPER